MGFRFRKSFGIAPGIRMNLCKPSASLSIGGRGVTVNVGKKDVWTTVGIPGTGISYSQHTPYGPSQNGAGQSQQVTLIGPIVLAIVVVVMIAVFSR